MGQESATAHSFVALCDLAVTYARHARWGMAIDCAVRAAGVAARMRHPVMHMDALALLATINAARDEVSGGAL